MSLFRRRLMMSAGNISADDIVLPDWFRDKIVCWYDVEKQKCNNTQMNTSNPILRDFSPIPKGIDGKHCDLYLKNFAWDESSGIAYRKNKRVIIFSNNLKNYGISDNQPKLDKYTLISSRGFAEFADNFSSFASKSENKGQGAFVIDYTENGGRTLSFFNSWRQHFIDNIYDNEIVIAKSSSYNGVGMGKGTSDDTNYLIVGATRSTGDYANIWLSKFLLFNDELSEDEDNWVLGNIINK